MGDRFDSIASKIADLFLDYGIKTATAHTASVLREMNADLIKALEDVQVQAFKDAASRTRGR